MRLTKFIVFHLPLTHSQFFSKIVAHLCHSIALYLFLNQIN